VLSVRERVWVCVVRRDQAARRVGEREGKGERERVVRETRGRVVRCRAAWCGVGQHGAALSLSLLPLS